MILKNTALAAAVVACSLAAATPALAEGVLEGKPESQAQQFSYSVGANIARQIKNRFAQDNVEIDSASLIGAMLDVMDGKPLRLDDAQMKTAMDTQRKATAEAQAKAGVENAAAGKAFQEKYAAGEGVTKTESGLLYKVIKAGDGKKPTSKDQVTVNYEGTLINGKVFDSSYKRGQPATFGVGRVIPGWQEVLQLMPAGSTYEVVIPSDLAYGANGTPGGIPPNSTLKFKVELIEIK
ncbi:MAG: FKBP-type peptidyl-prolyl cis-trans isomerase [Burkholderiaceae bacterium]